VAEKARVLLVDACTDAVVAVAAWLVLLALALFALSTVTQQQSRPLYGEGEPSEVFSPGPHEIASRQRGAGIEITR
jgi:hypothetical protein